jgi:NAD(P)-dependent dehydrogenase (short-subunit alcohol dehydrogenase family)
LITGAASGFGREFARRLSARGEGLVLWDLNEEGLAEVGEELGAHTEVVDVRDAEAVRAAADRSAKKVGAIGHAVHSAGVLRVGNALTEVGPDDYRLMIEVNYLGAVHVAQAVTPYLKKTAAAGGESTLLLIASVAGLRGFPELAGYSASKFAVVGFGQALRDELAGTGVAVRVLCPPPGDTPMVQKLDRLPPVYQLSKMFTAEQVVDGALKALERPEWLLLIDAKSKLLWRVGRAAPELVTKIVRRGSR